MVTRGHLDPTELPGDLGIRHFYAGGFSGMRSALGSPVDRIHEQSEIIGAVIDFANRVATPNWVHRTHRLGYEFAGPGWVTFDGEAVDESRVEAEAVAAIEEERQYAIDVLTDAASGLDTLLHRIRDELAAGRRCNIVLRPVLHWKGRKLSVDDVPVGDHGSSIGWTLYAAVLLAVSARGQQTDVGRCHFSECEKKFFKVNRTSSGRPATKYCSPDHLAEDHRLGNAERKRKSRANPKPRVRRRK